MNGPLERNGPERTAILEPGHDRSSFVSARDQQPRYSERLDFARARCDACALFHGFEAPGYTGQGECRAHPPQFYQDGLESGSWPRISGSDWCGVFVPGGNA